MKTYEERCDAALRVAHCGPHDWASKNIIACKLAEDVAEADELIAEGERRAANGLAPKRRPRYDYVMEDAEQELARRFGKLNARTMIDEEECDPLHRPGR